MRPFDVLVAGGGSAGLAAAVSAARAGARTLLVERDGMLGGMGTTALVHTICGLFQVRDDDRQEWANNGFARMFATRLLAAGGAQAPRHMGRLVVMPHDPAAFAVLADEITAETPNLEIWLHTEISGVAPDLGRMEVLCRGVRHQVAAAAFVDATGDATLTALAGGDFLLADPDRLQRPACIVGMRGFPEGFFTDENRLRLAYAFVGAVNSGRLPREALGAGFRQGAAGDEAFLTVDLAAGHAGEAWDPVCPRQLAAVSRLGRRTALAIAEYLRTSEAGCGSCRITHWPARVGVRESRRICGVHELTADEILCGVPFEDSIATVGWPVELRERATGPKWRFPESGVPGQIPLRSLRHRNLARLWVAGRCLSCTHEAQAALRVMGTCMATGEAAGFAAAMDRGQGRTDWKNFAEEIRRRSVEIFGTE